MTYYTHIQSQGNNLVQVTLHMHIAIKFCSSSWLYTLDVKFLWNFLYLAWLFMFLKGIFRILT